jgi:2-polyprenyl-3-methyl-5-hydroxy-6-metoxy-1,4-benzoquinol methylase
MSTWLHTERMAAVLAAVRACNATSILDLGCGSGDMLLRLMQEPQIKRIHGIDLSGAALDRLRASLAHQAPSDVLVTLDQASMTRATPALMGFECAILIETIEHLPPSHLAPLEAAIFGTMRPDRVIVTTPNAEFNDLLGVPRTRFRHPDHRFEWNRRQFQTWGQSVGQRCGYATTFHAVGGAHPDLGGASQMAIFDRQPTTTKLA